MSQSYRPSNPTKAFVSTPIDKTNKTKNDIAETPNPIRKAYKAMLQVYIKCRVLVTTFSSIFDTVHFRVCEKASHLTIADHGEVDVLSPIPFYISISNFSAKAIHLRKCMVIEYDMKAPKVVMIGSYILLRQFQWEPLRFQCNVH